MVSATGSEAYVLCVFMSSAAIHISSEMFQLQLAKSKQLQRLSNQYIHKREHMSVINACRG
jgi:hypothetical protein